MEKYLRENVKKGTSTSGNVTGPQSKKVKREECPHKERCYRKNPHHFKEFEHPFLNNLIDMGDSPTIPDNLPQPKQVYLEQLDILKPIRAILNIHANEEGELRRKKSTRNATDNDDIKATNSHSNDISIARPLVQPTTSTSLLSDSEKSQRQTEMNFKPGCMLEKFEKNKPYHVFFTTIPKSPSTLTEPNSVTFTDLLCPSLGPLKSSLQVNFMIDIDWLLKQYKARGLHQKPLAILYGDDWPDMVEFMKRFCPNVKYHFVKMKDPFGCHHSKVGIYVYEDDSIRVVVSTANLYFEDWNYYNQGLWMSPRLPKLPEGSTAKDGESLTGFKADLINYLTTYNVSLLKEYIDYVKKADFSEIRVALVYSAPGKQLPKQNGSHCLRVADLLGQHCSLPVKTTPQSEGPLSWGIMAQASSIGSMGKNPADWLRAVLMRSLSSHKNAVQGTTQASINLVYPSKMNVLSSYFGPQGGGCLPYSEATHNKQKWLQDYMHQWIADGKSRTRAMPHIKSYCRVSPGLNKLAYFLLTSANMSKSAWGTGIQGHGGTYVRSYEMGVMFLPKFFGEEYFDIVDGPERKNKQLFPFMYDLPLTPYKKDDSPWCN